MYTNISRYLDQLRTQKPLVHNITNNVVTNTTANALLAIGASPVMAHASDEVADMVALADTLVINTGTITRTDLESMIIAVDAAGCLKKPWILDPVGIGTTPFRLQANLKLLSYQPSAIRGNASEIITLCTGKPSGKGVDSEQPSESTIVFLQEKATETRATIAVTGATDIITNGRQIARLHNGDPMMTTITGTGCAATAIAGAFLAVCPPWDACVAALSCLGIAGEIAASISKGPGSLQFNLLDQLYQLNGPIIEQHLELEI
ncbi:hydroxyethylthiazole kinase [Candidatus Sororendozoicomonas aggregata]|uniref:hydroxyethylthiazole kinase n=1 Tax=Candidatus Sororendozoicomonas aggregata TaxID=3073239 RepID=UPI002ED3C196